MQFQLSNNCEKRNLINQVRMLIEGFKNQRHICLFGLNRIECQKEYYSNDNHAYQS